MALKKMHLSELTALSPLDGRYHKKTQLLQPYCSELALMRYRLIVEIHWLKALANHAQITALSPFNEETLQFLHEIIDNFNEQDATTIKKYESTTAHDVKALEYFLKERCKNHPILLANLEFIHFACTSEDINNLAYALMLKEVRDQVLLPLLKALQGQIEALAKQHVATPMLSRTHGQPATPTTLGKELVNVIERLKRQYHLLEQQQIFGKINGAVGNFSAHTAAYPEIDWISFSTETLQSLNLTPNLYTTQIEPHDYLAEFFDCLARINTILIDFSQDMWGYISLGYFIQKTSEQTVGSSTMPHKVNPINFENAEGNLGLCNAVLKHMGAKLPISRWQRDLSDSTVLRNIGVAFGYGVLSYQSLSEGLDKLSVNSAVIQAELKQHWALLAEPIQTVMRSHGVTNAYEQLKDLTRNKEVTPEILDQFIEQLPLPVAVKNELKLLKPENYLGQAITLAKKALGEPPTNDGGFFKTKR